MRIGQTKRTLLSVRTIDMSIDGKGRTDPFTVDVLLPYEASAALRAGAEKEEEEGAMAIKSIADKEISVTLSEVE